MKNQLKHLLILVSLGIMLICGQCFAGEKGVANFFWWTDMQYREKITAKTFFKGPKSAKNYAKLGERLANEYNAKNIDYGIFTGDMIWEADNNKGVYPWATWGWPNAEYIFKCIDYKRPSIKSGKRDIPYGVLAGNHDVLSDPLDVESYSDFEKSFKPYTSRFGKDKFKNKSCYREDFLNNVGHCDVVEAGGQNFVIIYMSYGINKMTDAKTKSVSGKECPVNEASKEWMNHVLDKYKNMKAILCFHDAKDTSSNSYSYYKDVVEKNDNVFMVLGGHYLARITSKKSDGNRVMAEDGGHSEKTVHFRKSDGTSRKVHILFHNYQEMENYGDCGYYRRIQLDLNKNSMKLWSENVVNKDVIDRVEINNVF